MATRAELINSLKQGCPVSAKLVDKIIVHLEMANQMEKNLKYYQGEVQRLEDLLAIKEGS